MPKLFLNLSKDNFHQVFMHTAVIFLVGLDHSWEFEGEAKEQFEIHVLIPVSLATPLCY